MKWTNKRVLVTGASGVIGSVLTRLLIGRGARVVSLDLKSGSHLLGVEAHLQADLSKGVPAEALAFRPDIVFHLAATFERTVEKGDFWRSTFDHNALASHYLLRAVEDLRCVETFVFASSYLIYDPALHVNAHGEHALVEDDPVAPRNLVGVAKYLTERELEFVAMSLERLRAISARIYRVYGRGSRDVISRWVRAALNHEPISVFDPHNRFDYIFSDDVAEGLIRLAEAHDARGVVNLGSGRSRSINDIVEILRSEMPTLQLNHATATGANEANHADMSRFAALTSWLPAIDVEHGIRSIIDFEKSQRQ